MTNFEEGLFSLLDFDYTEPICESDVEFVNSLQLFGFSDAFIHELNVQGGVYNYATFEKRMQLSRYDNWIPTNWFSIFGCKSTAKYIQDYIKCIILISFIHSFPLEPARTGNTLVDCHSYQLAKFNEYFVKTRRIVHAKFWERFATEKEQNNLGMSSWEKMQTRIMGQEAVAAKESASATAAANPGELSMEHWQQPPVIDICVVWDSDLESFPRMIAAIQSHLLQIGLEFCFDLDLIQEYDSRLFELLEMPGESKAFPDKYPTLTVARLKSASRIMYGILLSVFNDSIAQPILLESKEAMDGLICYLDIVSTYGDVKH